ncbi:MAG: hydrolase, partial [Bacteroidetes bacterium]|nr:hydrolase [Bacteroidota bacterium]
MSLFYSRRIGHSPSYSPNLEIGEYLKSPDNTTILSAIKFSGKTARGLSVGVLQSLTANEKATINTPSGDRSVVVEPLTNYVVTRMQQDLNKSNTVIGGIFTSA